jgi:hypothetical protein
MMMLSFGGCVVVRSESPMYEPSQRVVDASLEGRWIGCDEHCEQPREVILDLAPAADRSYWMTFDWDPRPDDDSAPMVMHVDLVQVGESLMAFLREDDLIVQELDGHFFPLHRLTKRDDRIVLDWVCHMAIADVLQETPEALKHEWATTTAPAITNSDGRALRTMGEVTLRATATDVQGFLLAHEHDERIFVRLAELRKVASR